VLTKKVDIANARIEFAGGCVANVTASRISIEDQRRMRIFQPDTYMSVDYSARKVAMYHRVLVPGNPNPKIVSEQVKVEPGDTLEMEVRSFIQASRNRTTPMVTGEDGKKALAVALDINEQIQANIKKIPSKTSFQEMKEDLLDASE
jgi:predicted dehydrogenase